MSDQVRKIIYQPGSGYYEEKKSRFFALAFPIASEEDVLTALAGIRKEKWDARHHCYAYSLGENHGICRYSDDGEPGGTAGRPILDVILGQDIQNICIIVTRYFGGTLLGTGGLVRAYTAAARDAVQQAEILEVYDGEEWRLLCDYALLGKVEYEAEKRGYARGKTEYGADCEISFYLKQEETDAFRRLMTELTQGEAVLHRERSLRFGQQGDTVCILP